MSWHYLPELAEASSAESSPASPPSAPWKWNRTAGKSCCGAKGTVCSPCSRSGTTSRPSTGHPGVELWISSLRASRASPSPSPGSPSESMTQKTSGPILSESYAKWNPSTHSWKTSQGFLPMTISAKSSETWQMRGSMRNGILYPRRKSVHPTSENGSGLWPTPKATDGSKGGPNQRGSKGDLTLPSAVNLWPTPSVCGNSNRKGASPTSGDGLATAVQRWPTPCSRDYRNDNLKHGNHSPGLARVAGGLLNPQWVEWLMGFPTGWLNLKPLEMHRFQEWLNSHGKPFDSYKP
jgi:hypothetical protein